MPTNNKNDNNLTKRQANRINRTNRNLVNNINALKDQLSNINYGTTNLDRIDNLSTTFNKILKTEMDDISKSSSGDTTSFITKLFSENNKRMASTIKDLESVFNSDQNRLETFLMERYRNRLIKQNDIHEIASQLIELQEAIIITRDAIVSSDIIEGNMSRILSIKDTDIDDNENDNYIPIIENIEKKFDLQKKIKNFIIPNSLETGEYYVYTAPYSKIFENFSKKNYNSNGRLVNYSLTEAVEGKTLYDITKENKTQNDIVKNITESVISEISEHDKKNNLNVKKNINEEVAAYMKNITICNDPIPLPILEEGLDSYMEYYKEFVEKTVTEAPGDNGGISFNKVMQSIDTGMHNSNSFLKKTDKKGETFDKIHDCYIKMIDSIHILPIEIMDEVIGYYYIQDEDITPLSGMLTSTVYYGKYDNNENENNILSQIAETIVAAFNKKFLEKNVKFKKLIVEALNYYQLNNRKIKFQYIPKEYIQPFIVNEDENGHGRSVIEKSLFYAKLYLMMLLFKIMSTILYSNDTKVNYIKQSGIEKNIANKIQEIARIKQQRQVQLTDMFSYTTLINKIGQGSEMYVPVGRSGERGIETEILSGQDVQINNEFMEMLKKAYITGTGVPDVLINYLHEAEFAKTLELANNRFNGLVVSYQLDYNRQITEWYKSILKYSTNIPEEIINNFEFTFSHPRHTSSTVTNELLSNHTALQDFLVQLYFGQSADDDENADKVMKFKKELAELRLSMLNFKEFEDIYKKACIDGTSDILRKANSGDTGDDGGGEEG